jgi:RNA polymerase sigma factor (sigma-70 family)
MSTHNESSMDASLASERRRLVSMAFRMLGTISEAEDVVQEAYVRWYRMPEYDRGQVLVPAAWLTRTASRICLDLLGSARVRRERYIGPWLPEPLPKSFPVPDGNNPLETVTLDDTVSTALMVVLESMTAAERVAFVLHDVFAVPFPEIAEIVGRTPAACRQLATSARTRIQSSPLRVVPRHEHDDVVRAFANANRTGDLRVLISTLDPDVVLHSDGGGRVSAALKPVYGADRVARFLRGILTKGGGFDILEQETHDGLGFGIWNDGRITGVVTLEVLHGMITKIRIVLNPEKLSLWN